MFFELEKNSFDRMLPLYRREEIIFPLILAVVQQKQPGWVFADDPLHPANLLVITRFGFTQSAGTGDLGSLAELFMTARPDLPSYILWYSPPHQAQRRFDSLLDGKVRRRERVRFAYKNQSFSENSFECPPGFEVRYLGKELIEKTSHFRLDLGSRFWESIEDFLENGFGTCVMKDGKIVSLCYSACVADHLAEIDIVTQEEYRGMGIAAVAGQNFIAECLRRSIRPTWDCFSNNTASMKLARKLGFEEQHLYYLYSFNIPITFAPV